MGKTVVVLLVLAASLSCIIGNASAFGYGVISADAIGNDKDAFEVGETVYAVTLFGSAVETTARVYIVEDQETWTLNDALIDVTPNDFEKVTAVGNCLITTAIWIPEDSDVGNYDIVLDSNCDGILNGNDRIDSQFGVGFSVHVPEFATIAMPVGAILGLLFFFNHRKRKKE